jgi:hypothetical protein
MNEAHAFVTSVYRAIDSMDEKQLAPFLTEDCIFAFGNAEPVVGRAASDLINERRNTKKRTDGLALTK